MHTTHNKALSSAYDVDLMSTIQIDDFHEWWCGVSLLCVAIESDLEKWKQAPF